MSENGNASDLRRRGLRRLLLVAHCFPPNPAPGSARAWRFYKYLPEFGYETHVITATRPEQPVERAHWVEAPPKNFSEKVLRKFFFPYDDEVSWTLPALRAARRLMAETPMHAVLSTVPFLPDHLVALAIKRRYRVPWVADYRDPIVGNPFRSTEGLPGSIDRFLDARCFANADLLVAVTDRVRQEWVQRCPEVAAKTAVIWNGYDPEEPIFAKALPTKPYRLVSHFGSFYGSRTPVPLLRSVMRLVERRELDRKTFRFRFVGPIDPAIVVGDGELFENLIAMADLASPVQRGRSGVAARIAGRDQQDCGEASGALSRTSADCTEASGYSAA